jgi:hypothetical protein
MFVGPRDRSAPLLIHKASFIVWLALFGLHLLVHVPGLPRSLRAVRMDSGLDGVGGAGSRGLGAAGSAGRWIVLAGALVGGAVLAVVLIPHFSLWNAPGAFPHHHH